MQLTEKRKADREKMAVILKGICDELGAKATIDHKPFGEISPQMVMVRIEAARGLKCGIDFDGKSCQPDVFVNAWHMGAKTDACLSDAFPGSVNQFHFSKSTTVCHGFGELCRHVRRVLEMARDGTCFSPEREAASVAKNGTWQERESRWETYRQEMRDQKATELAAA